jgi:hypothetical protein
MNDISKNWKQLTVYKTTNFLPRKFVAFYVGVDLVPESEFN